MRKLMMAASLVLSLAACGSKGGIDGALDKMESFKNEACKCSDKACTDKVMENMMKYMGEAEKSMKDAKPSKAQDERADKIMDEMGKCTEKFEKAPE